MARPTEETVQTLFPPKAQYIVPPYQRGLKWSVREWEDLFYDIFNLQHAPPVEDHSPNHSMGPIYTIETIDSRHDNDQKRELIIDGQQRLTFIQILLAAIRDLAEEEGDELLRDEIDDSLLIQRYGLKEAQDRYRMLPRAKDRQSFLEVIDKKFTPDNESTVARRAYEHFKKLLSSAIVTDLRKFMVTITGGLKFHKIALDPWDNQYAIFKCLNWSGLNLNYFEIARTLVFSKLHTSCHEFMNDRKWEPMEQNVRSVSRWKKDPTDMFLHHYLMKEAMKWFRQDDVLLEFERRLNDPEVVTDRLFLMSQYYKRLLQPQQFEEHPGVQAALIRLNRLDLSPSIPFLLALYEAWGAKTVTAEEVIEVIEVLENFFVRRMICRVSSNEYSLLFPPLFRRASSYSTVVAGVRAILGERSYPSDSQFHQAFQRAPIYKMKGKPRFILDCLEASFGHKEPVDASAGEVSVEHIAPKVPTSWWEEHLEPNLKLVYSSWVHTVGNLTLTGYNSKLAQKPFPEKKVLLQTSNFELSKSVVCQEEWKLEQIRDRGRLLADRAMMMIWKDIYPGRKKEAARVFTGDKPESVFLWGEPEIPVSSWQDVVRVTVEACARRFQDFSAVSGHYFEWVSDNPRAVLAWEAAVRLPNRYFYNPQSLLKIPAHKAVETGHTIIELLGGAHDDFKVVTEGDVYERQKEVLELLR